MFARGTSRRKRALPVAATVAAFVLASTATAGVEKRELVDRAAWAPGEVLVTYRDGTSAAERSSFRAGLGLRVSARVPSLDLEVVELARGVSVREAVAAYASDPRVEAVEPNYLRERTGAAPDPLLGHLWGLNNAGQSHALADSASSLAGTADADMDVFEAWALQAGSSETVVAVIDDGAEVAHPDLAPSLWTNPGELVNGIDDDGNGKVDDVHGWDFPHNDATLLAPSTVPGGNAHGTHVAGTIAAARDNGIGIAGVCPGCRIMVLKVMDDSGFITVASLIKALAYARAEGADIVNLSLGSSSYSTAERNAIAAGASRFLAVVAAGNDSLDNDMFLAADLDGNGSIDIQSPSYPASYTLPNILTVAATNHNDEYGYGTGCFASGLKKSTCAFSNWGHDSVDLGAPGVDIVSTVPVGAYAAFNGTSMATPNTAGVAGLVLSHRPGLTPVQVKNAVMRASDRPLSLRRLDTGIFATRQSGSFTRTNGRANALAALTASAAAATPASDGNVDGAKGIAGKASGAVRWPDDVNDVWKRALKRGKRYRVVLDGPRGKDFDLIVYRPGTKEIWILNRSCPKATRCIVAASTRSRTADEVVTFKAPVAGTYFFQVSAWLRNAGSYKLTVRAL